MATVAVISQKGGAGKTTLAPHLAVAAHEAGQVALVINTDRQATASQWVAWRQDRPPEVIDSPPPRLAAKIAAANGQVAGFTVVDTPPHAASAARSAFEIADLVLNLVPAERVRSRRDPRPPPKLVQLLRKPAFVVFTAGPSKAPRVSMPKRANWSRGMARRRAR